MVQAVDGYKRQGAVFQLLPGSGAELVEAGRFTLLSLVLGNLVQLSLIHISEYLEVPAWQLSENRRGQNRCPGTGAYLHPSPPAE